MGYKLIGHGVGIPFRMGGGGYGAAYWATREPTELELNVIYEERIDGTFTINGTGQDGHKVYTSTDNITFTFNQTLTGATNTFSITGLLAGTLYYVKVVAYKGIIESTGITDFARSIYNWWLQAGLTSADVLGAYKAIDIDTKANSLKNLNNPGTGDLVETGTLTWSSLTGWTDFLTSTLQFLTGPVYKTSTYSFAILFSDHTGVAGDRCFDAEPNQSGSYGTFILPNSGGNGYIRNANDLTIIAGGVTGGVLGATQTSYIVNGIVIDTMELTGIEYNVAFLIGVHPMEAPPYFADPFSGKVQAVVCFLSSITDAQMIAVQNLMKATNFITDNLTLRDFTGLSRVADAIIPHGTAAYNTFGTDTPYANKDNKIDGVYYALSQVCETYPNWLNLALYTSPDLLNWTDQGVVFSAGASGAWDDEYIVHPSVIKIGSTFHLYYSAQTGATSAIGHATSTDFINWTKDAGNPVYSGNGSGGHAYSPHVIKIGSLYYMYYWNGLTDGSKALEYATSSDGLTWAYGGIALSAPLATDWDYFADNGLTIDPWVIRNKQGYYEMVYTAVDIAVTQKIGYAISRDGIKWYKRQSVLIEGSGVGWDATYVADPVLLEKPDGTIYLYYVGMSGAYPGTASDGGMATL